MNGEEGLAELRRRVYAPDATDEDRRRYAAAVAPPPPAAVEVAPAPPSADPPASAPRRMRRRVLFAAVGAVAIGAIAIGVVLLRPSVPQGSAPEQLPTTVDERSTLANALVIGTDAGIAAYLLTHREPPELQNATSADTVEDRGIGPGDVALLHGSAAVDDDDVVIDGRTGQTLVPASGRVTVLLVTAAAADVGWALESRHRVVARRAGFQSAGALTSATIAFARGGRPVRVHVDVPSGVPWGIAAVYTD